jgi:hypothetical protein
MKSKILFAIVLALFIYIACGQQSAKMQNNELIIEKSQNTTIESKPDCVKLPFHYLVTNDVKDYNTRIIQVFLDEKAFSEQNLTTLFRYLSDKNPATDSSSYNNLQIWVKTDWSQLPFPSDCPPSANSGGDSGTKRNDYFWANFYRSEGKEYFTYNPTKGEWKNKGVIMKGDEFFQNGTWQKKNK